jgi:hypothetical protein
MDVKRKELREKGVEPQSFQAFRFNLAGKVVEVVWGANQIR